jgi:hypothetical protein
VTYSKTEENPIIKYSTFLGGSDDDGTLCGLLDSSNNPIIIGMTQSSDFPATIGTAPTSGNDDIFITKFNADNLSEILFSSIIGGNGYEWTESAVLDDEDNIYITGWTNSLDFATPDAYCDSYNGGTYDGFVSKISTNGTELFTTYIGGQYHDKLYVISLDSARNIWVVGGTQSNNYPLTSDAYDSNDEYGSYPDPGPKSRQSGEGVYSKLSGNGSILLYSSYLGGSDNDGLFRLDIDNSDNIILAGWTRSENFPTTNDAWDKTYAGGQESFITKFTANGSTMLYSTLIGGSGNEEIYGSIVDNEGNFIVCGWTDSADFPTSPDAFDSKIDGTADCFLTTISANGSTLIFSTLLGGSGVNVHYETMMFLAVDDISSNIYVVGRTNSLDFPTTDDSASKQGGCDIFVSIFPSNGSMLLFSTLIGGTKYSWPGSILLTTSKEAYIVFTTSSDDFPVTQDAYQDSYNGHTGTDLWWGDAGFMKVEFPSEYTNPLTEPPEQSTTTTTTSETPSAELVFILPLVVLAFSISRIFRKKRGEKFN